MPNNPDLKLATDWDRYYQSVPPTAVLTRKYTTRVLLWAIRSFTAPEDRNRLSVLEIGGANSCFVDQVLREIRPASYDVVDTNEYGLSLLARRAPDGSVRTYRQSVLALDYPHKVNVVFSVGLVEHFSPAETRAAVLAHFDVLAPGGIAIITFPTPTILYRLARKAIEVLGMWKFPDERPLMPREVLA